MARKEYCSLEYRSMHAVDNDIVSILKCFDKGKKDLSKRVLEEQILRVVKLHGSVEESDFVRLEIKAKDETSTPTKGSQIIEIISNSGGKTSETPIKSIDDFDPIKAFHKVDIYDMQRKLHEVTAMLDVECEKNKDLFTENERLKKEIEKLQKRKGKDESPEQRTKPIGVRRLRVGKCLSLHEADILKKYLDANNPMDAFWHGVHSAVYRKDALQLLNEEAVSIQVMDSFLEIFNSDQMALPKGQLKSCFMPTFGWGLMKCRDEVGKVAVYVEVVLKNLRDNDSLFLPIIHVKEEHFTFADAGVAVMYMIKTLSEGKALENVFPTGAMKNMRAHVLGKFINDEDGCWDAYRIN
ncbi:hypothetical protein ACE6H2_015603 [Prunus campanulata]